MKSGNLDKATIIDVRNPWEFDGAHVAGSINIPLHELPERIEDIKAMQKPIILCCVSGNRSGQGAMYLKQEGIDEVVNGGSWLDVNGIR